MQNYHIIKAKYLGATNYRGSRIKLTSERFEQSKVINYTYEFSNTLEIAENALKLLGFNLIGHAEGKDCYYIITDTFKGLVKEKGEGEAEATKKR